MRHILPLLLLVTACHQRQVDLAQLPTPTEVPAAATGIGTATDSVRDAEVARLQENFRRIGFGFDRAELDEGARTLLRENAAILRQYSDLVVEIQGHADHWGSDEYNLALGDRRAHAALRFLSDLGVASGRLRIISYGEERPLVQEGDKDTEQANRRAEFVVIQGQGVGSSTGV